jgi:predicted nucleotidyltransferase
MKASRDGTDGSRRRRFFPDQNPGRCHAQETYRFRFARPVQNRYPSKARMNITELREAIRSAFRGKPVSRVDLFGSAARGEMTPESDVDILVTPKPEATRRDLFIMAADVEEAVGRHVDFLIRADVEAMKNREARDLILKSAVPVYVA